METRKAKVNSPRARFSLKCTFLMYKTHKAYSPVITQKIIKNRTLYFVLHFPCSSSRISKISYFSKRYMI